VILPKDEDGQYKLDDSVDFGDSWAALEELHARGKAKAIGVSNFSVKK
jgi:diketogulonate reductase-like aldo/keto reductase